ncbi:hypothetical protein F8S13_03420 [Chloroflexia bacterium SDU3-3]|nr:hypothetical protein F8S13_03420 [Chloroflexia bacterium SDU3-3]
MRSAWLFLLPVAALLGGCGVADTSTAVPTYDWQLAEMGLDAGPTPTLSSTDATTEVLRNRNSTAVAQNRATTLAITPNDVGMPASNRRVIYTPVPPTHSPDGISSCKLDVAQFHAVMFSCFRKNQDDGVLLIAAGKEVVPQREGLQANSVLLIYKPHIEPFMYFLPTAEGSLMITAVSWPHLTLRSQAGKEHGFNAETLEWETPQATTAPTGTPTPERAFPSIR